MVLGIIAAMEEELQPLLGEMKAETTRTIAHMTFHEGYILNKKVVAVISGIGKVNSAICAQILITTFGATKVINVGVAGGVGDSIHCYRKDQHNFCHIILWNICLWKTVSLNHFILAIFSFTI